MAKILPPERYSRFRSVNNLFVAVLSIFDSQETPLAVHSAAPEAIRPAEATDQGVKITIPNLGSRSVFSC